MLSMTGYGQARRERDGRIMTAEVRCVNHRFLDLGLRLPRTLNALETLTRQLAGDKLTRGHADITVTYQNVREDAVAVTVDTGLARAYQAALSKLGDVLAAPDSQPPLTYIAGLPGVLREEPAEEDPAALEALLTDTLTEAFDQVCAARAREGERLKADLAEHLSLLDAPGPLGKQLDFLLQEMNREANTTASKSVSLDVTNLAVQCKNEIEKLREQAQNVL